MKISELLGVHKGITSLAGSGGKSTLLHLLAEEAEGTVILCTSTHMRLPEKSDYPFFSSGKEDLPAALQRNGKIYLGREETGSGKMIAPDCPIENLRTFADHVFVEADGSRGLPMKAHLPHEPAIPSGSDLVLCVLGNSCFGRPVAEVCHRPELLKKRFGVGPEEKVFPEMAAELLLSEYSFDELFLNQCDGDYQNAEALARLLPIPVYAGSLLRREWRLIAP